MKVKHIGILLLAILTFFGCSDNTGTLGMGMLPGEDNVKTSTTTFNVTTRSIAVDSVFAKTSTGYVGRFNDQEFGYYEASFLTELNCTENFKFPPVYNAEKKTGTMAGDTVVSIQLAIYYSSWFGDSLNACRMSVYQLDNKLAKNRYTNIDPKEFYNENDSKALLGRKAYSAYDPSVPDSVRNATDSYGNPTFYPNITFALKKDFGNELLQLNRNHPEYFKNADTFINNIFKGVYIKSDYGDGTVMYIDRVDLQMQFRFHYVDSAGVAMKKKDGTDSLFYSTATVFASTKEVIQANQFLNSDLIAERVAETGHTYIKSPAGIFTEATLPYGELNKQLSNDTLNAVKLTFTNYSQDNKHEFSMTAPRNVLLIRKKDLGSFFEKNNLPDNTTSYIVTHNNVAANQYTFNNIARLVTTSINEKNAAKNKAKTESAGTWDEVAEVAWEEKWTKENPEWDKVLLIPVTTTFDTSNSSSPTLTGILNDLKPGYAKLKGGPASEPLKIEVTYTSFGE